MDAGTAIALFVLVKKRMDIVDNFNAPNFQKLERFARFDITGIEFCSRVNINFCQYEAF